MKGGDNPSRCKVKQVNEDSNKGKRIDSILSEGEPWILIIKVNPTPFQTLLPPYGETEVREDNINWSLQVKEYHVRSPQILLVKED